MNNGGVGFADEFDKDRTPKDGGAAPPQSPGNGSFLISNL